MHKASHFSKKKCIEFPLPENTWQMLHFTDFASAWVATLLMQRSQLLPQVELAGLVRKPLPLGTLILFPSQRKQTNKFWDQLASRSHGICCWYQLNKSFHGVQWMSSRNSLKTISLLASCCAMVLIHPCWFFGPRQKNEWSHRDFAAQKRHKNSWQNGSDGSTTFWWPISQTNWQ